MVPKKPEAAWGYHTVHTLPILFPQLLMKPGVEAANELRFNQFDAELVRNLNMQGGLREDLTFSTLSKTNKTCGKNNGYSTLAELLK